jgi:site-specific DNA-methyltransferase (adenine-specific)
MKLINADCIAAMKEMHSNSVDSIVTDPPYELGFMGKSWDASGIAFSIEVWKEALRILKPGGHLIAFSGSRTYHRMAVAIEDAGFQIRDQIMWIYGSGFPKSHNLKDEWQGWGTALKPAHEPMVLARKPLISTVANNFLKFGVGGLNIDATRVAASAEDFAKLSKGVDAIRARGGVMENSWKNSSDLSNANPANELGRWPANVIHDGSDEVVALFPDTGKSTGGRIGKKTMGDVTNVPAGEYEAGDPGYGDSGSAARFFYCAKASKRDRNEGLEAFEDKPLAFSNQAKAELARGNVNFDGGDSKGHGNKIRHLKNHHPTVKPVMLMQYLVRLVTPPNGIVLDPFMGSGSTGKACAYEGFDFIGIDQSAEYVAIAQARIDFALEELNK